MIVTYTFDTDNPDQAADLATFAEANNWRRVVEDMAAALRSAVKYNDDHTAEKWRCQLHSIVDHYGVRLEG